MTTEILLAWISIGLGVAGLAYGIYQDRLRAKIARLARAQAWSNYQTAKNALGFFSDYMKSSATPPQTPISAQAHARMDELYQKAIHNVYSQYGRIDTKDIDRWIVSGRIEEYARPDFKRQTYDD